jgi:hypothetical protein
MYFMIAVHTVAVNVSNKNLMRFLYSQPRRATSHPVVGLIQIEFLHL